MSREADEKMIGRRGKSKPKSQSKASGLFVSFHPTKAERDAIKQMDFSYQDLYELLSSLPDAGLFIKITANQSGEALCAIVGEAGRGYNEGPILACFHVDIEMLLRQVKYMLSVKWPNYPAQAPTSTQLEFDW